LKIAYLLTQSLDSPSGLGRYGPLARAMARRGHQVEIYTLHPQFYSLKDRSFFHEGVSVHYVAPMHVRKRGSIKSYYPSWKLAPLVVYATAKLTKAAFSSKAEIIHIGKPHPMNSIAGILANKLKAKRLFLDCDDYEAGSSQFSNNLQKIIVTSFEQRTPFYAEAITTNTNFMKQMLINWGIPAEKIYYLPNGVDLSRFSSSSYGQVEELRAKLDLKGRRVVSYIGSMSLPSHPVGFLLKSFVQVIQILPDATLLLVGGGEDYENLKIQVIELGLDNQAFFTGIIPPDQVQYYYALSDVSVDPVYDDNAARGRSPLKLFESWACGVPFITGDVGDRSELMGNPPAGLVCKPGDEASLANAIIQVLQNPSMAEELQRRGHERVQSFLWDKFAKTMESIYLCKLGMTAANDEVEGTIV
jgi:glycosyltransferase involved in cell wall biosynthesis